MTQQVFADFLGINPATLSGIFNDRTKPTLNIVEAVRKKFPDISLDWLMFGTGGMYKDTPSAPAADAAAAPTHSTYMAQGFLQSSKSPEPVLDFDNVPAASTALHAASHQGGHYNATRNFRAETVREEVKIIDKPARRVTEIRVYYDDQTWESFVPSKK